MGHHARIDVSHHRFIVGELVLFDGAEAALVLDARLSYGVPIYDLRLANGYLAPGVVEGYLRPWPADRGLPEIRALRSDRFSSRAWCESGA